MPNGECARLSARLSATPHDLINENASTVATIWSDPGAIPNGPAIRMIGVSRRRKSGIVPASRRRAGSRGAAASPIPRASGVSRRRRVMSAGMSVSSARAASNGGGKDTASHHNPALRDCAERRLSRALASRSGACGVGFFNARASSIERGRGSCVKCCH